MDLNALVTLLAEILARMIAGIAPGGSGIPTLIDNLTTYLVVAAHGGGLIGGCVGTATYNVHGALVSCTQYGGNMAWVTIPTALRPIAESAARVLSLILFPTGM